MSACRQELLRGTQLRSGRTPALGTDWQTEEIVSLDAFDAGAD